VSISQPAAAAEPSSSFSARKVAIGYVVVGTLIAVAAVVSILVGRDEHPSPAVAGFYTSASTCLGTNFKVSQSGQFVDFGQGPGGKFRLQDRRLKGDVSCVKGGSAAADLAVQGSGTSAKLVGTVGSEHVTAKFSAPLPAPGTSSKPPPKRSSEETFGRLMLAIAVVVLAARLVGTAIARFNQPRVMGEVLAGILLGPTLLGAVWPAAKDYLFPPDIVPLLSAAASIGLAFYLFLVGMELDPRLLRERYREAAFISNTSVAFPMALGFIVALPLYRVLGPDVRYTPFALFMAVAMSITAFPVLARILTERRMLKRPVGALTMAGAAIDDVTAWGLLALATATATAASGLHALWVVLLTAAFTAAMILIGRPLLGRVSRSYDEVGRVPTLWLGMIFVAVMLSAYVSESIGVAAIFGAFIVGLIMPRNAGLTEDVRGRFEDFVVAVLLPLFFVVTGLKTDIGSLNRPIMWLITLLLIAVAIVGKWLGAMVAARYSGFNLRDSAAIGALMNTRGLTELIVLNIGLSLGMISPALFTMLVVMALVTTFMTGPALRLIDPRRELSEPAEEELRRAPRATEAELAAPAPLRSILVAPQDRANLDALLALAAPLARSTPPRELILAEVVVPNRYVTGVLYDQRDTHVVSERLNARRGELIAQGIATRAVAFTSVHPGRDYVRMGSEEEIDLILMDGRQRLLGDGVPGGPVGDVLQKAPSDVAVLVERKGVPEIGAERPVYVPFGGAPHDWAAVELAAWIASVRRAPLRLIGAADGEGESGRRLAQVALVVQQLAEIQVEPLPVVVSNDGIVRATADAGLLVIGLSERWSSEGLGDVRSAIAKKAAAPILFVRRGSRPGALSSEEAGVTRFAWSRVGAVTPA
jgi:Kef-type K+ transport system membrane component KefB